MLATHTRAPVQMERSKKGKREGPEASFVRRRTFPSHRACARTRRHLQRSTRRKDERGERGVDMAFAGLCADEAEGFVWAFERVASGSKGLLYDDDDDDSTGRCPKTQSSAFSLSPSLPPALSRSVIVPSILGPPSNAFSLSLPLSLSISTTRTFRPAI